MNELQLQLLAFFKSLAVVCFAYLYGVGGVLKKYIRRIIGALWVMGTMVVFSWVRGSFNPLILLYPVLLCASLHLGYGEDDFLGKLRRRIVYGLAIGASCLPLAFVSGLWTLFVIHLALAVFASVAFGVLNPFYCARDEETVIGALAVLLPYFMV